ncbi:MAG TPA: T9SS type A sorting domain-containing protein, partial [Bacteroidales bacterium]|nr:T9SS type A sorting domain-containing protein [Bacteroidales bacterium]
QEHGKDIGFVMKIDSAGTIQWVEQMYRETDTTYGGHSEFYSVDINEDDGQLYISGRGNAVYYNNSSFHSIFPNGDAFEAPCYECSGNTGSASYLLAMDKNDGTVLWHSSPYTESRNYIGNVEYANDSLYVGLRWGTALHFQDTVFMHDGSKPTFTIGFSHLTYNTAGELCSVRNLRTDNGFDVWAHDTKVDAAGNIFFTGRMDADLDFNGDTSLFVSSASMFLARYGTECPVYGDTSVLVCRGTAFSFAGQEFTTPGVHPVLVESSGTDSIVNLHLQHTPAISSGLPQDTLICTGYAANFTAASGYESYLWQDGSTGQMFSTMYSSEQTDTLTVTMGKTFDTSQGDMYCEWTDTIIVSADICSSYEQLQQASLQLHPNPASSSTELAFPATQNAILLLYDSSGRLVQQTQISGSSYTLNLSNLETGMYHVKLVGDGYSSCEKLVVR